MAAASLQALGPVFFVPGLVGRYLQGASADLGWMGGHVCGRFTQKFTWPELIELYRLTQTPPNLRPNYNVCPTDPISVIIPGDNGLFLMPMRWQLIPRWWKKSLKELPATFNARAETVAEKPTFRDAFKRNRCLIPAFGYFEWHTVGKEKQPYYFTPQTGSVLTIAGLWEEWRDRVNNETITSCTMLITTANKFIGTIHDRMPVILDPENIGPVGKRGNGIDYDTLISDLEDSVIRLGETLHEQKQAVELELGMVE